MDFLYWLEDLRNPVVDEIMLAVTRLGEETAFLALALIFFWCVDKRKGYYIMGVGFLGIMANQFLKLWFRIPRPWIKDPDFTILEQARDAASGYSFPSGHTQTAVGTFGSIAAGSTVKWVRVICIALAVLVSFSRMYIGVHTPMDVAVSILIAVLLVCVLRPLVLKGSAKTMKLLLAGMIALAIGLLLFVEFYPFPMDVDSHNLTSGVKNAYTMLGSLVGVAVVYAADERKLRFSEKAPIPGQICKVVFGLVLVLAVKEGLRSPLDAVFSGHMAARAVRYFLIVITAGILWPLTFRFWGRIGQKEKKA